MGCDPYKSRINKTDYSTQYHVQSILGKRVQYEFEVALDTVDLL